MSDSNRKSRPQAQPAVETAQPTKWYYQEMWRRLFDNEAGNGQKTRRALVNLSAYPIPGGDHPFQVANSRAALHDIVDELSHDDLIAVFNVARILCLVPDNGDVVEYSREHQRNFRARVAQTLMDEVVA